MGTSSRISEELLPRGGDEFLSALRGGDLDQSEKLMCDLPENLPDPLLRGVAELHMLRERWRAAQTALARIRRRDLEVPARQRLCANLDALQTHRPQIYKVIADAEPDDRYELIDSKAGPRT